MVNLFLYANYYYNLGFNITHVIPKINQERGNCNNPFKSSTNDRDELGKLRQRFNDIQNFNWADAVGIGTELGFNNLRALDFDGCNDLDFIIKVLEQLGLPRNYEWLVKSGSNNGFHILFYAEEHNYLFDNSKTKAFVPNTENRNNFSVLELRWTKHLILPPSLSKEFNLYKFVNCELPLEHPWGIDLSIIEKLISWLCVEKNGLSNVNTNGVQIYYQHEFLDFTPIDLRQGKEINKRYNYDFEKISFNYFESAVRNLIVGSFNKAFNDFKLGFDNCACDCDLTRQFNKNYEEVLHSFKTNYANCKAYELDFIRAVFYFFIDSGNFNVPQKGIYLQALPLIESYINHCPNEEIGYYIKGRIFSGLDKFEESVNELETALSIKITPRVYYRIGRIKEAKMGQNGIGPLYKSILLYPSSLCVNRWFKEIAEKRNIKLSSDDTLLTNYFNNKSDLEYFSILRRFKDDGKVELKSGKILETNEALDDYVNSLEIDIKLFSGEIIEHKQILNLKSKKEQERTIKRVFSILKDYRSDENNESVKIKEDDIMTWICQFDENERLIILQEMENIFKHRYCSKEKMINFLSSTIIDLAKKNGYSDIASFLKVTTFLNLQPQGKSQGVILDHLNNLLKQKYNLTINDCGKQRTLFCIYIDDILCTGLTLVNDIIEWSKQKNQHGLINKVLVENEEIKLFFVYAFSHNYNYQKKIHEMRRKISKKFSDACELISMIQVENSIDNDSALDLIFPVEDKEQNLFGNTQNDLIYNYKQSVIKNVDKHTKQYNTNSLDEFYRPKNLPFFELFFSNENNREVIENAFLVKGIEILNKVKAPNKNMRPLGYSLPSLKNFGFGALCFTWRNIPNNAPLVLWYSYGGFTPLFKVSRGVKNIDIPKDLRTDDFTENDLPF